MERSNETCQSYSSSAKRSSSSKGRIEDEDEDENDEEDDHSSLVDMFLFSMRKEDSWPA